MSSLTETARAASSFAIIYNTAKNDGGFNENAVQGAARFSKETGIDVREQVAGTPDDVTRALRTFANHGITDILVMGFINEAAVAAAAHDFPQVHFTLIDGVVDLPNVRSVLFQEDQAAYLVGVAAALASQTGKVGFIGGLAIPPIRRFECGFVQGVHATRPQTVVLRHYLGTDSSVFRNRPLGVSAGTEMLQQGVDVVFAAAGFAGNGVLDAAASAGKLGIGVDTNQDDLHPGSVLTSALKRVDVAVYSSLKDAADDKWSAGVKRLTLADQGIGWSRDQNNEKLVAGLSDAVDKAAAAIAAGSITVIDYENEPLCKLDAAP
ncbi:MAG: BMP family ABC transporter substrate-binding protein [Azospirillaceae bacterium]|nr:BMP family ABC transporter substrate-binding protein [Azospirillaceae bacterium]